MAIADKIYSLNQRPTAQIRINGALVHDWVAIHGGEAIGSVPFLDIVLPEFPAAQTRGVPVTLDAGYDSDTVRLFTGGMFAWGDEDPEALRTQCFLRGVTDEVTGAVLEVTATVIDPPAVWPPIATDTFIDFSVDNSLIWEADNAAEVAKRELWRQRRIPRTPSGTVLGLVAHALGDLHGAFRSYKIAARDVSGLMLKAAMASVLGDSGVAAWTLDFDDYALASSGAVLDRMPGSEALGLMMQLKGCEVQQLRSGVVLISVVEQIPGPSAAFSYSTEDQDIARIIEATGELKIPFNPLLQSGMTLDITIDFLGLSGRWFLRGHRYELTQTGAWSYLDLIGGEDFGNSVGVNPKPAFFYTVTLEMIAGVLTATVQFDATPSFDPDGELTASMISWTDNQASHKISGTGFIKTITLDPTVITGTWEVSCTNTDADGLTATEMQTIDLSAAGSVTYIPAIGVAADTHSMFSPDSAVNWNDNAESQNTAVGLRPQDGVHNGHGLYGFNDGHIELTRDSNATRTTILAAVGSRIKKIAWDWRNTSIAWFITDDCRLYRAVDMDVTTPTFELYEDLRTELGLAGALGNLIGLPGAGGVWIFGGTGTGFPLIAYDGVVDSHAWVQQITLGDILTDGAGGATLRIAGYTAPGYAGETMILTNCGGRANGSIAIYHATSGGGPMNTWTRATGLTAGLTDGRVILENGPLAAVPRIALFNDRDAWKSFDGIAYTKTANVLPAGFTCNDAMWESTVLTGLPEFDGVYLLALENAGTTGGVYKSTDELSSEVKVLRNSASTHAWSAGAKALQLSIGASVVVAASTPARLASSGTNASPRTVSQLTAGAWSTPVAVAGITGTNPRLFCLTSSLWFITNTGNLQTRQGGAGNGRRSQDGGLTWGTPGDPTSGSGGVVAYARGVDGRTWCIWQSATGEDSNISWSDDDGDTWTLSKNMNAGGGGHARAFLLACHPSNPNVVVAFVDTTLFLGTNHWGAFCVTQTRGASWAVNGQSALSTADDSFNGRHLMVLPNGRVIISGVFPGGGTTYIVAYTDDYGATAVTIAVSYVTPGVITALFRNVTGSVLAFMYTVNPAASPRDHRLMISTDHAATWAQQALAQELQTFLAANKTIGQLEGDRFDGDKFFLSFGGVSPYVVELTPVGSTGVWSLANTSYPYTSVGGDPLCVIPTPLGIL